MIKAQEEYEGWQSEEDMDGIKPIHEGVLPKRIALRCAKHYRESIRERELIIVAHLHHGEDTVMVSRLEHSRELCLFTNTILPKACTCNYIITFLLVYFYSYTWQEEKEHCRKYV